MPKLKVRLHDIKLGTVPSREKDGHHIFSLVNFGDLPSWDVIESPFELFWKNSSYVRGLSVCIFVALYVRMFVAGANNVQGTMSWCIRTNKILASNR